MGEGPRMLSIKRHCRALVAVCALVVAVLAGSASTASADNWVRVQQSGSRAGSIWYQTTDLVTENAWNLGGPVASCTAGSTGIGCTISYGTAITTTVQVSLGVTNSYLANSLGFSLGRTTTTTVQCAQTSMKKGQTMRVYRLGTLKQYRLKRQDYNENRSSWSYSGTLTAFQPYSGVQVYCYVS
jgi:hypothetical protein